MRYLLAVGLYLMAGMAWADDIVFCDPTHPFVPNAVTRVEWAYDPTTLPSLTNLLIWTAPNISMMPEQITAMNQLRSQLDALAGVPVSYWICTDIAPVDGVLESVAEMSQAQKDTLDAPEVAEAQRQQTFTTEITTNDLCSSDLSVLDTKIDTAIDAASNLTQLKTVLKTGLKKIVRCTRARAR